MSDHLILLMSVYHRFYLLLISLLTRLMTDNLPIGGVLPRPLSNPAVLSKTNASNSTATATIKRILKATQPETKELSRFIRAPHCARLGSATDRGCRRRRHRDIATAFLPALKLLVHRS